MTDAAPHSSAEPTQGPTRRDLLAGMTGLAALAALPTAAGAAAASVPLLEASAKLTGIPLDLADLNLARTVWAALEPAYGTPVLERLVLTILDAPDSRPLKDVLLEQGLLPAAQAVAATWYTGASAADGGQTVLFYNDALMWRSCTFTKPPATCGGPFGYWAQAYQPVASGHATSDKA